MGTSGLAAGARGGFFSCDTLFLFSSETQEACLQLTHGMSQHLRGCNFMHGGLNQFQTQKVSPSSVRRGIVAKNLLANHPGTSWVTSLLRQGLVTPVTPANPVALAHYKWNVKFFQQGALRMTANTV